MGRQKYQVCDCCGKKLPKNINYFKKYSHKTAEGLNFHTTCRDCELKQKYDEEWKDEFGGQLTLYLEDENKSEKELDILPLAGRLAVFDSKSIPHEVKTVNRPRYSITGWLKTRGNILTYL